MKRFLAILLLTLCPWGAAQADVLSETVQFTYAEPAAEDATAYPWSVALPEYTQAEADAGLSAFAEGVHVEAYPDLLI